MSANRLTDAIRLAAQATHYAVADLPTMTETVEAWGHEDWRYMAIGAGVDHPDTATQLLTVRILRLGEDTVDVPRSTAVTALVEYEAQERQALYTIEDNGRTFHRSKRLAHVRNVLAQLLTALGLDPVDEARKRAGFAEPTPTCTGQASLGSAA